VTSPMSDVDVETLLKRVRELVENARPMPLSTTVRIEKDEVLEFLNDAIDRLPNELREARWLLKEREEYLAKVQREADEILDAARVRAERMVQKTEIVREANHTAQKTVEDAREEARRLRLEAEDYCDQKLGQFEVVLDRTIKTIQAGRQKLQAVPLPHADDAAIAGMEGRADDAFFDQEA
jgi:cell division septum initiation protein DivIVA